ncbi:MAG: glycerophosphodiester phosphodiesterase [Candidatus Thorarchaeota archaeon]
MENKRPLIIAHRGASGTLPENTLEAFWGAICANADIIEMDLQLTKDNEIVIFHDKTIERIFPELNQNSKINDFNLIDLQKYDSGSWLNKNYSHCRIPSLKDVFQNIPKNISLILEIKGSEQLLIDKTLEMISLYDRSLHKGYISVQNIDNYHYIIDNTKNKIKVALMQKKRSIEEFMNIVKENNIQIAQIRSQSWTSKDIKLLKESGVMIIAFYADYPQQYEVLFQNNIDGIFTNFPIRLGSFLYSKTF